MFCPLLTQSVQRRRFATELRATNPAIRRERVRSAIMQTGGTLIDNQHESNWGPVNTELSLMGMYHSGSDFDEAIANWIKASMRADPLPAAQTEVIHA